MAANSRPSTEVLIPKKPKKVWNNNHHHNHGNGNGNRDLSVDNSPERSPVWIEPKLKTVAGAMTVRKVPVLYYLTRNGHIEHPHLIDVPLSTPHGLYLRDVMNTLDYHRGKGMANMYSWSFKRSYKSGYVWHDLSEDDLIQPTNGNDYVLKGSELLQTHATQNLLETTNVNATGDDYRSTAAATAVIRKRNQSWSSFDNPQEYLVVKCESSRELAAKFAADAATQTEERRFRQSSLGDRKEHMSVLSREEMPSPPPSNSSSEVSEGVSGSRYVDQTAASVMDRDRTVEDQHGTSVRMKASQVLMQMITCGAGSAVRAVNTVRRSKEDEEGSRARVAYGKGLRR